MIMLMCILYNKKLRIMLFNLFNTILNKFSFSLIVNYFERYKYQKKQKLKQKYALKYGSTCTFSQILYLVNNFPLKIDTKVKILNVKVSID